MKLCSKAKAALQLQKYLMKAAKLAVSNSHLPIFNMLPIQV
jgi:hypothetical protein